VRNGGFATDNVVSLDDRRDANSFRAAIVPPVNTNDTALCADKNFGTASDFRRERQSNIEFGSGFQFLFQGKINTARGNVSRAAISGIFGFFNWQTDYDG
jgi:hypothetical protein